MYSIILDMVKLTRIYVMAEALGSKLTIQGF